jgi:uncharacterized membrane protein
MKKDEFIKKLKENLSGLPQTEIDDIISDYEEHFASGKESKRTENELCQSLGDPKTLGKQLRASYHIEKAENATSPGEIIRAVLATAGLGFFNLTFIAFPFFMLVFFLCMIIFAAITALIIGIVVFFASVFTTIFPHVITGHIILSGSPIISMFVSFAIIGFSALFLIACWYFLKWFYRITVSYLKLNVKIIKGEK